MNFITKTNNVIVPSSVDSSKVGCCCAWCPMDVPSALTFRADERFELHALQAIMSESSVASTLHQFKAVATALPEQSTSLQQSCNILIRTGHRAGTSIHCQMARERVRYGSCAIECPGLHTLSTCTGNRLFHQVHDRGVSATYRHGVAGHMLENYTKQSDPSDGQNTVLEFCSHRDMFTSVGCACHDAHNSLRWAFPNVLSSSVLE
eukprot:3814935-Amphidinium_carterae.3